MGCHTKMLVYSMGPNVDKMFASPNKSRDSSIWESGIHPWRAPSWIVLNRYKHVEICPSSQKVQLAIPMANMPTSWCLHVVFDWFPPFQKRIIPVQYGKWPGWLSSYSVKWHHGNFEFLCCSNICSIAHLILGSLFKLLWHYIVSNVHFLQVIL